MKFSGVFAVAEVWLTAKIQFLIFRLGFSKFAADVCKIAELFAKIFLPFQYSTRMWLLLQKEFLGFSLIVNLKEVLLDFVNSFGIPNFWS